MATNKADYDDVTDTKDEFLPEEELEEDEELDDEEDEEVAVSKYTETIGNPSEKDYTIVHNLGTTDVIIQVWNPITGDYYDSNKVERKIINGDMIALTFKPAPQENAAQVVVIG